MDKIKEAFWLLGNEDSQVASGFTAGLLWYIPFNRRFLQNPFSYLFWGSVSGSFYMMIASLVASRLPKFLKPLLPLCLLASIIYFKRRDLLEDKKCDTCKKCWHIDDPDVKFEAPGVQFGIKFGHLHEQETDVLVEDDAVPEAEHQ